MNARDQIVLAGKVGAAFLAARLQVEHLKQRDGHAYYPPAEMVDVVGALYRAGFVVRDLNAAEAPARPARLIVFHKERP